MGTRKKVARSFSERTVRTFSRYHDKYFTFFTGSADVHDFEDDPDLMLKGQEAEAWSVTVDKKVRQVEILSLF